jgi:CBS domain-containing protein
MKHFMAAHLHRKLREQSCGCTRCVFPPETELFTLASIFSSHGYRHLTVVEHGELMGIIRRRDVLKAMDEFHQDAIKIKSHDEQRSRPDVRKIINLRFLAKSL